MKKLQSIILTGLVLSLSSGSISPMSFFKNCLGYNSKKSEVQQENNPNKNNEASRLEDSTPDNLYFSTIEEENNATTAQTIASNAWKKAKAGTKLGYKGAKISAPYVKTAIIYTGKGIANGIIFAAPYVGRTIGAVIGLTGKLIVVSSPYIGKAVCKTVELSGKGAQKVGNKINEIGKKQLAKRDFINGVKKAATKGQKYTQENLTDELDGWVEVSPAA